MKKKIDLEKENAELKAKIREFKLREEWLSVKLNSMYRNMKEMEDEHALKMEEWKNKFDWNELEMEEWRLQVKQLEETNVGLTMQVQQDMGLSKKNKEMKVNVLTAIVVVCIAAICIVVSLSGKGVYKNKMLALP